MNKLKKSTIVLIVFAVVAAILAGWSIPAQVARVNSDIDSIGTVEYTDSCKQKIDAAVDHYNALDSQLNLKSQVKGLWKLDAAKVEYCRLAIKDASVADARQKVDNLTSTDVQNKVTAARAVVTKYLTSDDYANVKNYSDLTTLETKYAPSSGSSSSVDIPMC